MSYLRSDASPHSSTAEMWGYGRGGFLSRQSVTQIEAILMLFFPFFQTFKVLLHSNIKQNSNTCQIETGQRLKYAFTKKV